MSELNDNYHDFTQGEYNWFYKATQISPAPHQEPIPAVIFGMNDENTATEFALIPTDLQPGRPVADVEVRYWAEGRLGAVVDHSELPETVLNEASQRLLPSLFKAGYTPEPTIFHNLIHGGEKTLETEDKPNLSLPGEHITTMKIDGTSWQVNGTLRGAKNIPEIAFGQVGTEDSFVLTPQQLELSSQKMADPIIRELITGQPGMKVEFTDFPDIFLSNLIEIYAMHCRENGYELHQNGQGITQPLTKITPNGDNMETTLYAGGHQWELSPHKRGDTPVLKIKDLTADKVFALEPESNPGTDKNIGKVKFKDMSAKKDEEPLGVRDLPLELQVELSHVYEQHVIASGYTLSDNALNVFPHHQQLAQAAYECRNLTPFSMGRFTAQPVADHREEHARSIEIDTILAARDYATERGEDPNAAAARMKAYFDSAPERRAGLEAELAELDISTEEYAKRVLSRPQAEAPGESYSQYVTRRRTEAKEQEQSGELQR